MSAATALSNRDIENSYLEGISVSSVAWTARIERDYISTLDPWALRTEMAQRKHLQLLQRESPESTSALTDLEFHRNQQALLRLISKFEVIPLTFGPGEGSLASRASAEAASGFVRLLPENCRLPKISPDGDGDVVMVWEDDRSVIITVEGWRLHVVIDPGTPQTEYFPNIHFDGEAFPKQLLAVLPRR